jgi:hypothetical protein
VIETFLQWYEKRIDELARRAQVLLDKPNASEQQKLNAEIDRTIQEGEQTRARHRSDGSLDRAPGLGVGAVLFGGAAVSWRRDRQHDGLIIAQGCDCFQGHVSGALNRPFVVLLE